MGMRGEMDEISYRMEWGDINTEWGMQNLRLMMIDLCNIKLKIKEYQITDLGIIPVLPTQRRIIPVLT